MTRLEETREALMDALGEWYEARRGASGMDVDEDLIDAYAAYQRAMNGEVDDERT